MSYPYHQQGHYPQVPQGGHPQHYGYPPAPYGYPSPPPGYPQPVATAVPAVCAGLLFGLCSVLCFVFAVPGFDGAKVSSMTRLMALIGQAFSEHTTRNIDFGVSVTMTIGGITALLAVLLICRLGFARWLLIVLSVLVAAYYIYALVRLADLGAPSKFYTWIVVALIGWTSAGILAALPATGRAMRGYRPPVARW
ncbi:hypothetical protein [Nocardia wallacei]|uniref:hypothetical protein n=1 Tax=Nocardia wallacei TaxID=480035 RepID=UPI00245470B3|nr:hypothetical protein [Nocardia wallacei]